MLNALSFVLLTVAYAMLFAWAFRTLPQEGWQILASLPVRQDGRGGWSGINLTYYGVLTASAVTLAVAVVIVLMGSLSVAPLLVGSLVVAMLAVTVPAAKTVARAIEHRPNTFTIGGASFVGLIAAPWLILFVNATVGPSLQAELPMFATLALLAIAYALGEGTGRLACISFGCCYGRPVSALPVWLGRLFRRWHFAFAGWTKKVAYEGQLEAVPVIPIQALTAVLYVGTAMGGLALFMSGRMLAAFLATVLITHLWRATSELLRADHRGTGRFSPYQLLAVAGGLYAVLMTLVVRPEPAIVPDLAAGLGALWRLEVIVSLQAVWLGIFLYTGRSKVTASTISFSIVKDQL